MKIAAQRKTTAMIMNTKIPAPLSMEERLGDVAVRLVEVRHDSMAGKWQLKCAACGPLGSFFQGWQAMRAAEAHEVMHAETD